MRRLSVAFDLLNAELFEGQLPQVMLQLRNKPGSYGYFQPNKWKAPDGRVLDLISLDSATATERPLIELASTLAHEMCHSYVFTFVNSRRTSGGHGKAWRTEMNRLGLPPVKCGATWRTATHRIDPLGLFAQAFTRREQQLQALPWQECVDSAGGSKRAPDRVRFHCELCGAGFHARPTLQALCALCSTPERPVPFIHAGSNGTGPAGGDVDEPCEAPPSRSPGLPVWTDEASRELRTHTGLTEPPTNTTEALMVLTAGMDEHQGLVQSLLRSIEQKDDTYESTLKAVYRVRCRRLHPDAGGSEIAFKALQIAYRILAKA